MKRDVHDSADHPVIPDTVRPDIRAYVDSTCFREALNIPDNALLALDFIGQGEYNENYRFIHPVDGRDLVLRINHGSQMHLAHQISYEFHALELLVGSSRTPLPVWCDGSDTAPGNGALVMTFLPGRWLDYRTDMGQAAAILADIHAVSIPTTHGLVQPMKPLQAMLDECQAMYAVYRGWAQARCETVACIDRMLQVAALVDDDVHPLPGHIISTELNATNFLIVDEEVVGVPDVFVSSARSTGFSASPYSSLVDWEKPIVGEVVQDLAHFLAPTTTFFKTDVLLPLDAMHAFIDRYERAVAERFDTTGLHDRFTAYLTLTCLRGVTWCAMAKVEYARPGRVLTNDITARKVDEFLEPRFLDRVMDGYMGV